MDGGAWWAAVHGVAEVDTTERLHFHFSLPPWLWPEEAYLSLLGLAEIVVRMLLLLLLSCFSRVRLCATP